MVSLIKQGKHALIMMREHYHLNQLEVAVKKKLPIQSVLAIRTFTKKE